MAQVPVKRKDIKKLGERLNMLASLTDAERTLLSAVFAVAADVMSPDNGFGYTTLVQADRKNRLTVAVPDDILAVPDDILTSATSRAPDRVASSYTPGSLPADDAADAMARKITDRALQQITEEQKLIKITSPPKKITGAISVRFEMEGGQDDCGDATSDPEPK